MEQYVLHVTRNCNLRCKYCYERDRVTTYTVDEIYDTCKAIADNNEKEYGVEFIGGEPLLAFENVKAGYEYFRKLNKKIHFTISTNLFHISTEIIEWLRDKEDIVLSVSLDGNAFMNQLRVDLEGKGSIDRVVHHIKIMIKELGASRVVVHMTMHPYNVAYLSDGIKYIHSIGVKSVGVGIVETTIQIGKEFADTYIKEMNKVSKLLRTGELDGLSISELKHVKPTTDARTYVYGDGGKIIYESYGRAKEDSITRDEVKAVKVVGPATELINHIRETVFNINQNRLYVYDNEPVVSVEDLLDFECGINYVYPSDNLTITTLTCDHGTYKALSEKSPIPLAENLVLTKAYLDKKFAELGFLELSHKGNTITMPTNKMMGIGLNRTQSIYRALEIFLHDRIVNFDNKFPTICYEDSVTKFIQSQHYDVWIKDTSFDTYPCVTVVTKSQHTGQYKYIVRCNFDKEKAIKEAIALVQFYSNGRMDMSFMKGGKDINLLRESFHEKGEISNLFLIERLECYMFLSQDYSVSFIRG